MIKNIEIKNFKAIAKGKVKLTPLTAFIGYNGMGKSSMLEGLQMFKSIIEEGLDSAIRPWREFEHIYYKGKKKEVTVFRLVTEGTVGEFFSFFFRFFRRAD